MLAEKLYLPYFVQLFSTKAFLSFSPHILLTYLTYLLFPTKVRLFFAQKLCLKLMFILK